MKLVVPISEGAGENRLIAIGVHIEAERDEDGTIQKIRLLTPTEFPRGSTEFDLLQRNFEPVVCS